MSEITIRTGEAEEIEGLGFNLYDEDNEGDEIVVAEVAGQIVAFAQVTGNQIHFLESNAKGAGVAIVNSLKGEYGSLTARNVSKASAGFWTKMGFERGQATGERPGEYDYEWYAD